MEIKGRFESTVAYRGVSVLNAHVKGGSDYFRDNSKVKREFCRERFLSYPQQLPESHWISLCFKIKLAFFF